MCCYKLVTCEFVWWGLQGRVEKLIQKVSAEYTVQQFVCDQQSKNRLLYFTTDHCLETYTVMGC